MHVVSKSKEFETAVYELGFYFGFFKRSRFSETILRFYPDDGLTSDVKYRTSGLGVYVFLPAFSALNSVFSFDFRKFSFVFGLLSFLGVGQ
jgi:hypothetical protein